MKIKKYRQKLKAAINDAGLTTIEVSKQTGINSVYMSSFITGRSNPTREEAEKIACFLKMNAEDLF